MQEQFSDGLTVQRAIVVQRRAKDYLLYSLATGHGIGYGGTMYSSWANHFLFCLRLA